MATNDPSTSERRTTPLSAKLAQRIRSEGPLGVDQFMAACLLDPEHGYYVRKQALGARGDFITAPEISQVFGELLGLWSVVVWQSMGSPQRFGLIELGPGRGAMMKDAMRAARIVPSFLAAAEIVLIETSEALAAAQRDALGNVGAPVEWRRDAAGLGIDRPSIWLGNELLDALPVRQHLMTQSGWQERTVELDTAGRLIFGSREASRDAMPLLPHAAGAGDIIETRDWRPVIAPIAEACARAPTAALLIDYGHAETLIGDTLQAVRQHRFEHPLASPGEADLSAQVDFADLARAASAAGLAVDGPISQAALLSALGIAERSSRLMASNPRQAAAIEAAAARLTSPTGMGTRFKAIALRAPQLASLPGFPAQRE